MNTVLVAGATGFVGREVARHVAGAGRRVTGLARHGPHSEDFVCTDISNMTQLERALGGAAFDCIMHLASCPGDTGNPEEMVAVNVRGCLNLLEYARRHSCRRFVLAGSISAYEWYPATKFHRADYLPVDEEHPCRPRDMYSTTKFAQELLAGTYHHQYGLDTVCLRLTAVVGPRGRGGGRSWRQFAQALAEGKRVQVPHFSAEEVCHYVDVRDVAHMFLAAAEHPRAAGETFICAGPEPASGHQFVEAVQQLFPGIEVEFGFPWSMAQGEQLYFSMAKARELMGFEPQYHLLDSLRSIKEWIDAGGLEATGEAADTTYAAGVRAR